MAPYSSSLICPPLSTPLTTISSNTDSPPSSSPALPSTGSSPTLPTALPQSGLTHTRPPSRSITHSVPQGSVLGPLLFNIYLLLMFDIFTDYPDISFHTYADDLQLYLNFTNSPTYAPERLSSCIKSIHQWLTSNSLKLNPTKTEAIFLHLPLRSSTLPEPPPISLDNTTLPYSQHFRNLGFHLDTTLSLDYHLIYMHQSIHYHLHCIRLIRLSIPLPIAITIASSYIIPLFDYCNSLLFILQDYKLIKLQRLQNAQRPFTSPMFP